MTEPNAVEDLDGDNQHAPPTPKTVKPSPTPKTVKPSHNDVCWGKGSNGQNGFFSNDRFNAMIVGAWHGCNIASAEPKVKRSTLGTLYGIFVGETTPPRRFWIRTCRAERLHGRPEYKELNSDEVMCRLPAHAKNVTRPKQSAIGPHEPIVGTSGHDKPRISIKLPNKVRDNEIMTADLEQLSIGSWESVIAPAPCLDKTLIHGSCRGKPEAALPNIPKKRAASRSPAAHLSPTAAPVNKRSSARVKKRRTLVQSCIAKKPSARPEENTLCYENCTNATSPIRNRVSATEVGYTYYNTKDPNSRLMVCRKCQAESQKPGAGRRFIHDRFCVLSKNYLKDPATVREEKKDQKRMADLKKPPARDTKNSSVPMEQTLHRYFTAGPDITPRGEAEVFLSGRTEEWLNQFTNTHYWITKLRVAAKVKYGWDPPRDTWQDAIVLPPGHVHYPFHCLLMLMCSGRVTDLSLIRVFAELFGQYDNLSPQDVLDMEVGVLETYLSPLGLAATRVPQILSTCHTIIDKFKGEVPSNVEGLMQLMGVGAKGAHIMMKEVFGEDTGVGIDCHLVRIFYRLGWSSTEHNVDICRKEVEALFPKVQWGDINRIYAGLGQLIQEDPTRIMNIAIHHVPLVVPALLDLIDMYAEKKKTKNST